MHLIRFSTISVTANIARENSVIVFSCIFILFKRYELRGNKQFYYDCDFFPRVLCQQKLFYLKINSEMLTFILYSIDDVLIFELFIFCLLAFRF